ncbi:sensor domain-containing diguanylate cyclase [Vibrio sonorensis]|uniref:sensor domain-containing diguanylate cyclase n=1 Tax=Vibrio sonorensis TaxID=1004316 RepID=UPI0008D9E5E1|nr:sensor domain-containing diguanylate cyclase [Vibrio sonorensis]
MKTERHFSLAAVFFIPGVVTVILLGLIVKNYFDSVARDVSEEYQRIETSIERATKILTALDYSFSNYYKSGTALLLEHNRTAEDGLCRMWPIDALLLSEGKNQAIPAVDISYMLVGDKSLCDPNSPLYKRVSSKVSLAPILSFLHDLDDYVLGMHYIDKSGYVMSSPETLAKNINKSLLETVKARPVWHITINNRETITIAGPANVYSLSDRVVTMTVPIYFQDELQGIVSLDLDIDALLSTNGKLASPIHFSSDEPQLTPATARWIYPLKMEGVKFHHHLYYQFEWQPQVQHFFALESDSLAVIASLYVMSVFVLFYINTHVEKSYFRELSAKDPMTGLLNRRGLEAFLGNAQHGNYLAIAIFDIDNFKSINDTWGHDVGDDVIRHIGKELEKNLRSNDSVARFGGEEFVIYMTGDAKDGLVASMQRVRSAIGESSFKVLEKGFTLSGGIEVAKSEAGWDFETMFKAADEKLYLAKNQGKDQLVS